MCKKAVSLGVRADSAVWIERRLDRLVALVNLDDLRNGSGSHWSSETEIALNIKVGERLKLKLAGA